MTLDQVPNSVDVRSTYKFGYNVITLSISFLSVICDIIIGLALILQYYTLGYTLWALITFSLIFFPSVIMQILSIKIYLSHNMMPIQWLLHSLLLGIIHRYISAIRKCVASYKLKSCMDSNAVKAELIILRNFYLFKSFMECAPQLVLQLYFMTAVNALIPLTGILASTSAFSVAWALIIHTKVRKKNYCPGLAFLVIWRAGMIIARIAALVLCAYTCGPWIILFIGCHWLAMTLWITYQKATMDEKDKKGEFYSALFGVIYCFCFFSIKTEQSRSNTIIFNCLVLFQNLIFLTVFVMSFSAKSPRLVVLSFVTVIFGSLLGITSFFVYNTFFHPRGPFKCISSKESMCCETAKSLVNRRSRSNLSIATKNRGKSDNINQKPENEHLQHVQSPSDSIIIIEENPTPNSKAEDNTLQKQMENIYDEPNPNRGEKESELKFSAALKRRAICSSVDLTRFLDKKSEDVELESTRSLKGVSVEETQSEILSTHDYENLCAVNIAREQWGIRSWGVYSDIETYRHDDSVFNERRLDNVTTSSEYSAKIEDKDSLNAVEDDLLNCEIDTNSDKTWVNFIPPFPASMLHTIFEENESFFPDVQHIKAKCNSESALVATIDKICLYTPLRSRSGSIVNYAEASEIGREPNQVEKVKVVKPEASAEKEKRYGSLSPMSCVEKFNIFKERYETNRYRVSEKMCSQCDGGSGISKGEPRNPEHNATKKNFSFKDKSSFLVQMLSPTKLERRKFPISPPKR